MNDVRTLTAICGIDCFNCPVLSSNLTSETRTRLAAVYGIAPAAVSCNGCRADEGRFAGCQQCQTRECALERGHEFCFECADFPCRRLQPTADRAALLPHNCKVYNLCRIKRVGVEKWAAEEALRVRRRYYAGKIVIGDGPRLDDE